MKKRIIKFRAWDGEKMIYSKEAGSFTKPSDTTNIGYVINNYSDLMQFTGLKDKNGREVYENDILNGRNGILKIVYWCEERASFCESEQFKPTPANHSFSQLYEKFGKIF